MYDCSKEFSTFYRKKVVLSAKEQDELRKRRKQNIRRIKDGLNEYVVIFFFISFINTC